MLCAFLLVWSLGRGGRPPTAAMVLDRRTISVLSGSKLYLPVKEGEKETFGLCLVGDTSACFEDDLAVFDSHEERCALRTPGCECWQWVSSAQWSSEDDGAGTLVSRSAERPDCLVVSIEGSGRRETREIAVRNRLLRNENRYLTRGGKLALETIHRTVWGGGDDAVSASRFVALHAKEWCDGSGINHTAFPCEGPDIFTLRVETFSRDEADRAKTMLYYGWPLGVVFGVVGIVFLADRIY